MGSHTYGLKSQLLTFSRYFGENQKQQPESRLTRWMYGRGGGVAGGVGAGALWIYVPSSLLSRYRELTGTSVRVIITVRNSDRMFYAIRSIRLNFSGKRFGAAQYGGGILTGNFSFSPSRTVFYTIVCYACETWRVIIRTGRVAFSSGKFDNDPGAPGREYKFRGIFQRSLHVKRDIPFERHSKGARRFRVSRVRDVSVNRRWCRNKNYWN